MWRNVAIGLLFCTPVIGWAYLLWSMRIVKPNHKLIVIDNFADRDKDRVQTLNSGIHLVLSPFKIFGDEISTQVQTLRLNTFAVKTFDNVDTLVEADITYCIQDPAKAILVVNDYRTMFPENAKSALSAAIQSLNYANVNTAQVNKMTKHAGHVERAHDDTELYVSSSTSSASSMRQEGKEEGEANHADIASSMNSPQFKHEELIRHKEGAEWFQHFIKTVEEWGIKIINFRLNNVEPKHAKVAQALELTAEATVRAAAQEKAANAQANTIRILAEAERAAQITQAQAAVDAATHLTDKRVALDIYTQANKVKMAQALGAGSPSLILTPDLGGASVSGMSMFSSTGLGRKNGLGQRSLSSNNLGNNAVKKATAFGYSE